MLDGPRSHEPAGIPSPVAGDLPSSLEAALPTAVLVLHLPSLTVRDANAAALRLLGYEREHLVGGAAEPLHGGGEPWEELAGRLFGPLERSEARREEWTLRRGDGSLVPAELTVSRAELPGDSGELAACLLRARTDGSHSDDPPGRDLRGAVLDAASEGLFMKDLSGTLLLVNRAAARMMGGFEPSEVVGRRDEEVLPPRTMETIRVVDRQLLETGQAQRVHERITTAGGEERRLDVALLSLRDEETGARIGVVGSVRDVTEEIRTGHRLKETHELLDAVLEGAGDAVFAKDGEGRYLMINDAGAQLLGSRPEEVVGRADSEFFDAEMAEELRRTERRVMESGKRIESTHRVRLPDGSERLFDLVKSPLRDAAERIVGIVGITRDLTERTEMLSALRLTEEKYEKLFHATPLGLAVSTLDRGEFLEVNAGFESLLGYPRRELLNRSALDLGIWFDPKDRGRVAELVRRRGAARGVDVRLRRKDGEVLEAEIFAEEQEIDGVRCLLTATRDVTERRSFERELQRVALHDSLTGLANRNLFRDRLEHALQAARRRDGQVAVLFVDLDRFKVVNDTLGHAAGDLLLTMAADRIRSGFRAGDTVGRLGGDEFGILLEEIASPEDSVAAAERLLRSFEVPFEVTGEEVHQSISIGICVSSDELRRPDDLLRFSDIAMYRAKRAHAGSYHVFESASEATEAKRLHRENELRRAIEAGQLELEFQPMVELSSGRIAGAEALVRWRHPERGTIPPRDFIPLAEDTGLIVALGRRVLEDATRIVGDWKRDVLDDDSHFRLSVNLSGRQYDASEFVQDVVRCLQSSGLRPEELQIEITETVAMRGGEKFEPLRRLGVHLAIDDFGTGYSSLQYLLSIHADVIKVDRAFTAEVAHSRPHEALVEAILGVAAALDMEVVVEGIETGDQLEILRRRGCRLGQGFYFSRPLPPEEFVRLLGEGCPLPHSPPG